MYSSYLELLGEELVPALGCTEPGAVAYAAALARRALGREPGRMELHCSGSILKNVKGVTAPNTGGLRGAEAAGVAGALAGDPSLGLEVLKSVPDSLHGRIAALASGGFCRVLLAGDIEGVHIEARVFSGPDQACALIRGTYSGVVAVERNGIPAGLPRQPGMPRQLPPDGKADGQAASARAGTESGPGPEPGLALAEIREFADQAKIDDLRPILGEQARINDALADEGLRGSYGISVGRHLAARGSDDARTMARARAAAGSDARMGGCPLPAVINSGSGNQGITVSVPVTEYARRLGSGEEKLLRALALANLAAIKQKRLIGAMSAFCGAVSAAAGAAAGIAYLEGADTGRIGNTIAIALAASGGILCDGAKASCPAKIATALEAAIMAEELAVHDGAAFREGDGLVGADPEETIRNFGTVASEGMRETDRRVIGLMLGH